MKRLFFLLFLALILICSCKPKSNYTFTTANAGEVLNFIVQTNKVKSIFCRDITASEYALPTKEWVKDVFIPDFTKYIFNNDLGWPVEGSNDCDVYAIHALSRAKLLFYKDPNKNKYLSLAVGQFNYFVNLGRHAVIFFITDDNGKRELIFFDASQGKIVNLDNEKETVGDSFVI